MREIERGDFSKEFTATDGSFYFYGIVNALAEPDMVYLDLGAGRAAWYEDSPVYYRRKLRLMRGKVREVIAADVDPIVMENWTSDRNVMIQDGKLPLDTESVDMIVSDYVLEHIEDVAAFAIEVDRVLKPDGLFCARTPHKFNYVSVGARLMSEGIEGWLLSKLQPGRKSMDVFPKFYRLNTLNEIRAAFPSYADSSFVFRAEPSYHFGNRMVYSMLSLVHRIMPSAFAGNLFVIMRKPYAAGEKRACAPCSKPLT